MSEAELQAAIARTEALWRRLDFMARQYHQRSLVENKMEHKFWRFENCSSEICRDNRAALGIPQPAPLPAAKAGAPTSAREPGAEG